MYKFLLLIFILTSCTTTKYYIVRHAEKTDAVSDPVLSKDGIQRAADLADYFVNNGIRIDSIYTSDSLRTVLTGYTVALRFSINVERVKQKETFEIDKFIARLKKIENRKLLIVSHSDIIPKLIQKMAGFTIRDIKENEYDNLYILTKKGNDWTLEHALYGKVKLTRDVFNPKQPIK